jgi:hypothetical protein
MRGGYSIASVLMLTIVAAIVLAGVRVLLGSEGLPERDAEMGGSIGFVGAIVAMFLGDALGRLQGQRSLGTLAGIAFGLIGAFLLVVPNQFVLVLIGSAVLILFAVGVRFLSRRAARRDDEPC